MPARPGAWRIALLILALIAISIGAAQLSGCASRGASGVFHDPSFDSEAVKEGGITLLAVTTKPGMEESSVFATDYLTQQLLETLSDRRSSLNVIPGAQAVDLLGTANALMLLESYRENNRFAPDELDELALVAPLARYAILARLDMNFVEHTYEVFTQDEGEQVTQGVRFQTSRAVGGTFDVFETDGGVLVFTIYLHRKASDSRTEGIGTAKLQDQEQFNTTIWSYDESPTKYPDPPGFVGQLDNLYRDFVRQLPK